MNMIKELELVNTNTEEGDHNDSGDTAKLEALQAEMKAIQESQKHNSIMKLKASKAAQVLETQKANEAVKLHKVCMDCRDTCAYTYINTNPSTYRNLKIAPRSSERNNKLYMLLPKRMLISCWRYSYWISKSKVYTCIYVHTYVHLPTLVFYRNERCNGE